MIKVIQQSDRDSYRIYSPEGISRTLRANVGDLGAKTGVYEVKAVTERRTEHAKKIRKTMIKKGRDWVARRDKEIVPRDDNLSNCLTATKNVEQMITDGKAYWQLTPLECERLQGFPEGWTEGISDVQRYKCLGNAVTVPVVEFIAKNFTQEVLRQ